MSVPILLTYRKEAILWVMAKVLALSSFPPGEVCVYSLGEKRN